MKVRIDIDTNTFVRFWLVVIGFSLAGLAIYSARDALILVGVAFFLALALNRPVNALANWLPGKSRIGGTALAYIAVIAFLAVIIFMVVPPIVQQTAKFAQTVPGLIDGASSQWQGVNAFVDNNGLRPQVDNAMNAIKGNAASWATNFGSNVLSSLGSFASLLASTFLVLVLSFLMLIEGPAWLRRIWGVYNDRDRMEYHRKLVTRMYNVVTGYVTGQLTVSAIGASLAGLFVFILSFIFPEVEANLAMPTAAVAFVLSLVPMFGATIAGILVTALLALNSVPAAIAFAIYFLIYQQIENNFVSPTIQSKAVELSALAVLTSVTVGLYVFGLAGGIISIPIAGCIKVLLEDYLARAKVERTKSDKPLHKLVKKLQKET
jgi:predicted PurR-regulated permease PerM